MRQQIAGHSPWEAEAGYSRAVRCGRLVFVAGTTGTGADGRVTSPADAHAQALQAITNIAAALEAAGGRLEDIVRTRLYVVRPEDVADVIRAHRERLGAVRPAATLVRVAALIEPEMLVEIEADAVLDERRGAAAG
jgi:enamine deaminase RidA (YjgF/YER057c/UK114 family)